MLILWSFSWLLGRSCCCFDQSFISILSFTETFIKWTFRLRFVWNLWALTLTCHWCLYVFCSCYGWLSRLQILGILFYMPYMLQGCQTPYNHYQGHVMIRRQGLPHVHWTLKVIGSVFTDSNSDEILFPQFQLFLKQSPRLLLWEDLRFSNRSNRVAPTPPWFLFFPRRP